MTFPPNSPPFLSANHFSKAIPAAMANGDHEDTTEPQPSPPRDIRDVKVGELFDAMMEQAVVTFRDGDSKDAADLKTVARRFLHDACLIARECSDLNISLSYGQRIEGTPARRLDVKA